MNATEQAITAPYKFLTTDEAYQKYELSETGGLFGTELDRQLYEEGIATITMPVADGDFEQLIYSYEACIDDCPTALTKLYYKVDNRHGNEAGVVRKEAKFDPVSGLQTADAKSIFHFNEQAQAMWENNRGLRPAKLATFLLNGYELHHELIKVAKDQFAQLEETHPNITNAYYPSLTGASISFSFMRVLSYDAYKTDGLIGDVAKPHKDIGGATIQAYADAPGFWGSKDGVLGDRTYYQSEKGEAQFFMGQGHEKLYGPNSRLRALAHGVGRIVSSKVLVVPKRHSVIQFIDAPFVNYGVTQADTLPQLYASKAQ